MPKSETCLVPGELGGRAFRSARRHPIDLGFETLPGKILFEDHFPARARFRPTVRRQRRGRSLR